MMRRAAAFCSILMFASVVRPTEADACGLKLAAKTPTPKAIARTISGSVLLLVNDSNLESQLVSSGHTVEKAPNAGAAKRKQYNVVVADQNTVEEARVAFGDDAVILRSGNASSDSQQVAARAHRRPVRVRDSALVAYRTARTPIAAGPTPTEKPKGAIASGSGELNVKAGGGTAPETRPATTTVAAVTPKPETTPTPPAPKPENNTPPPEKIAATPRPTPSETTPTPKPVAAPRAQAFARVEIHFGTGSASVSGGWQKQLDRTAKWLAANADARIVVEGHADPSGNPDANMALSRTRAEAVRDYLTSAGVDSSRIDVEAFGDTKLKYGAADGRNRRVVVNKQ